jgi:hypothetical protein
VGQLALARDEALAVEGQQRGRVAPVVGPRVAGALVEGDGEVAADLEVAERESGRGRPRGARRR